MEVSDRVGILHDILKYFWKYDISVSRIESRPVLGQKFDFFVDFDGRRGAIPMSKNSSWPAFVSSPTSCSSWMKRRFSGFLDTFLNLI
jgi:hypothetical protein